MCVGKSGTDLHFVVVPRGVGGAPEKKYRVLEALSTGYRVATSPNVRNRSDSIFFFFNASVVLLGLLGQLAFFALPGWEEAESRRAADTAAEASCRSHASGSGARGFDADSSGAGYGGDVGRADRYAGD
jgi:hypothetical protein